jgi:hypothetical protein
MLDGQSHTVIVVLPSAFEPPNLRYLYDVSRTADAPQLWKPFALWNEPSLAQAFGFVSVARLRDGVSEAQAAGELNALQKQIALSSGRLEGLQARIVRLHEQIAARSPTTLLLMFAVAFACSSSAV